MRTSSLLVSFLVGIIFLVLLGAPVAEGRSIDVKGRQTNNILPTTTTAFEPLSYRSPQNVNDSSTATSTSYRPKIRRRLPDGDYGFGSFDAASAEAGFAAGLLVLVLLALLLCCCCCGGGRRGGCSLWDLVAMVCLWEMCCDRDGVGDGFMML